ncbi:MAG TPA: type VI secretion system baseplate subunit TssE [Bradyrhizobium sp.]|jgi:type VI secretion system protein ImpF|nr:type VI secretion system baseplate subunit TssE [Bradyrhizobium sp.]
MRNSNKQSRLSPPLMHVFRSAHEAKDAKRIIDQRNEAGDRVIASRRLRARQVITESMLRREVSRDLDALLNTIALDATVDMEHAPHVRRSILNFGLPDIANRTIDENRVDKIPDEIRTAIAIYEPRIAPDTLRIARDTELDPVELKIRFVIRGELVCHPVHVPVEFIADIVESGKIIVNRL